MTITNRLDAAKQGNPEAIAALMNKALQSRGIAVKATLVDRCLTITAEAQSAPPGQPALVGFVRQGVTDLNPQSIEKIIVQGKASDQEQVAWQETVELNVSQSNDTGVSKSQAPKSQAPKSQVSKPQVSKPQVSISNAKTKKISERLVWLLRFRDHANTALLAGILLTLLVGGWSANRPKPVFWEYKVEGISDATFEYMMQEMGAQGWDLASARRAISGEGSSSEGLYEVIFKRQITRSQAKRNLKDLQAQLEASNLQAKHSTAQTYVGVINRSQQAYFLENTAFSQSLTGLDLGIPIDTEDYVYSISLEGKGKAIVTAAAKNDELKSYTGAVAFVDRYTTEVVTCESETPSKTPPAAPTVNGNELQCAAGSAEPN